MIAGVFLAAGQSQRFGTHKLLYEVKGKPLIYYSLKSCVDSFLPEIYVILGTQSKALESTINRFFDRKKIKIVLNEEPKRGMISSLRKGICSLEAKYQGAMIFLGDMPFVTPEIINILLNTFENNIIIPECDEELHHPRIIPAKLFPEFLQLNDDEEGMKVIKKFKNDIIKVKTGNKINYIDIDQMQDLDSIGDHVYDRLLPQNKRSISMNLLIHNITIFTNDDQDTILENHAVAIEGSRIKEVGSESELKEKYSDFVHLDGKSRLLMPGLINTHSHFYSTFARGLALSSQPQKFSDILAMLWWKLDSALDPEAIYYSALIPAITAIKKGVTAVIDHHASPNAVDGSLDRIEEALTQVGLRSVLCYEVSDRDGKEIGQKGLQENERYIKKCRAAKEENPDFMFDGMIGLHASFTLENETLEQAAELSRTLQKGCHIHLLEDPADWLETLKNYKIRVVDRLNKFGILQEQTIAAHCIHLSEEEKDLIAQSKSIVIHNPQSNMNNAVGRTDIFGFLERGVLLGIGTDGMSADIKPDVRTALWLHKHALRNYNVGWNETQQMTLKNNPAIFQRVCGQKSGRVEADYLADLILIDYYSPTPLTADNFWGHFLFGIADAEIDTTIINGKIVMKNRELVNIDEEKIAREGRRVAKKVWGKIDDKTT